VFDTSNIQIKDILTAFWADHITDHDN